MSDTFRELLKSIGSGVHTGKNLTRDQAELATRLMLTGEATPAQIGAFLIAHRIKRPTSEELAGILDAYDEFGPKLSIDPSSFAYPVTVFGNPYDGRSRTAPVMPVTALLLATEGVPVVLHGGERMPTKYGISLAEIWRGLGLNFTELSLDGVRDCLLETGLTFLYTPKHFPAVQSLVPYREQIGKRPPLATVELIWSPIGGKIHQIAGFVHPPTEERFRETLALRGIDHFTTVKGLEGSCDLAGSRTAIIGLGNPSEPSSFERFLLHPRDYNFRSGDPDLDSPETLCRQLQEIIESRENELTDAVILNGGFYLWRCGVSADLAGAFDRARTLLRSGKVRDKLRSIERVLDRVRS